MARRHVVLDAIAPFVPRSVPAGDGERAVDPARAPGRTDRLQPDWLRRRSVVRSRRRRWDGFRA